MPGDDAVAIASPGAPADTELGLSLSALDDATRERLGLDSKATGVLIREVTAGGAAARQGLRAGDVILRVGRNTVADPGQVRDAVRTAAKEERSSVVLLVRRDGSERFVAVPFERG
jgi:serine protease Do